jgi:hypothetical protein
VKKVLTSIWGMGAGVFVAVIGTVMHQTIIGGFPFGITLAFLTVLGFGLRARAHRLRGWLFAIALAVVIFITGQSSNQDSMIPATTLGYTWGYGSIALAIFIAMFPRFKKN